ncbi:unnamed protein product [Prorocentrum cordatum]|uniref:Uncharacterized protein n=1 Tax=Prorocentrum cordatum TaxID=2364126 RepID=A0ABN9S032_9DINO|nr:unnamed protein product [Polarella glacialis]
MPGGSRFNQGGTVDFKGWLPPPDGGEFCAGEPVEYWSTTHGKWLCARVLRANLDGSLDLDCRAGASKGQVRRPDAAARAVLQEAPAQPAFSIGELVEYYSTTYNGWVQAVVMAFCNGLYTLNCKPGVPPERVRRIDGQPSVQPHAMPLAGAALQQAPPLLAPPAMPRSDQAGPSGQAAVGVGDGFPCGEQVEYFSSTHGRWLSTAVLGQNADGTVDLACRAAALPQNIRRPAAAPVASASPRQPQAPACPPAGAAGAPPLRASEGVEHSSAAHGRWIPGVVLGVNASGNYDLNCKSDAQPGLLRRQASSGGPPLELAAGSAR